MGLQPKGRRSLHATGRHWVRGRAACSHGGHPERGDHTGAHQYFGGGGQVAHVQRAALVRVVPQLGVVPVEVAQAAQGVVHKGEGHHRLCGQHQKGEGDLVHLNQGRHVGHQRQRAHTRKPDGEAGAGDSVDDGRDGGDGEVVVAGWRAGVGVDHVRRNGSLPQQLLMVLWRPQKVGALGVRRRLGKVLGPLAAQVPGGHKLLSGTRRGG
mmetsp:Transcript_25729/g.45813  ORF Transcript_25729/g.45813 Transcript_25729/m.45813 type:complete len:210 (-) Transcript_25729:205-834(-)